MISPVKLWRRQKEVRAYLGNIGTIITWTKVVVAGTGFKKYAPYPVVIVEFADGRRATGQLVDYKPEDLKIGTKVASVLRKVREHTSEDVIAYGLKFKPLSS